MNNKVDAVGQACPMPVIKAKRALSEMKSGTLEVLVDNDVAVENLKRMAGSAECGFRFEKDGSGVFHVFILKDKETAAPTEDPAEKSDACMPCSGGSVTAAVISSETMGSGDDELGKILMRGFIFALTQMPQPPSVLIFYNGGARLSTEGSASIEDLRKLEDSGTEIITCGTCLKHFGLTEKLKVGSISNMYEITEKMSEAARILRP